MSTKDKKSFDERMSDLNEKNSAELRKTWGEMQTAWKPIKKPFFFIVGAVVLITLLGANGPSDQELHCEDTETASFYATASAEYHIKQRLHDPDSAEFPAHAVRVSRTGDCSFMIVGTVRARNAFGGLVLNTYVATTQYDIETDYTRTTLISLD